MNYKTALKNASLIYQIDKVCSKCDKLKKKKTIKKKIIKKNKINEFIEKSNNFSDNVNELMAILPINQKELNKLIKNNKKLIKEAKLLKIIDEIKYLNDTYDYLLSFKE